MRVRGWVFVVSLASNGCGGAISTDGFTQGDAIADAHLDAHADAHADTALDAADTAPDVYVDPMCPDAPAPPNQYACDPLASPSTCASGESCVPWVQYPTDPCDHEVYGASCVAAGTGTQGTPCGTSGSYECAAGYVCVVSGAGDVCTRMCKAGEPGACPDGLVCSPTDVPGIGSCL